MPGSTPNSKLDVRQTGREHVVNLRKHSLFQMVDTDHSGQIDESEFGDLYELIRKQTEDDIAKQMTADRKVQVSKRRTKLFACFGLVMALFLGLSVAANFVGTYSTRRKAPSQPLAAQRRPPLPHPHAGRSQPPAARPDPRPCCPGPGRPRCARRPKPSPALLTIPPPPLPRTWDLPPPSLSVRRSCRLCCHSDVCAP